MFEKKNPGISIKKSHISDTSRLWKWKHRATYVRSISKGKQPILYFDFFALDKFNVSFVLWLYFYYIFSVINLEI